MPLEHVLKEVFAAEDAAPSSAPSLNSAAPAPGRSSDWLTRRERGVAALVAHGLTNRQIGDKLALSERTVEAHVRNILQKLSLVSRTQVATWWVVEQGPFPVAGG